MGRWGEERERNINRLPLHAPRLGLNPQPTHMPRLGSEPATFHFADEAQCSLVRAPNTFYSHLMFLELVL